MASGNIDVDVETPFTSMAFRHTVLASRQTKCLTYSEAWMQGTKWHLNEMIGDNGCFSIQDWAHVEQQQQTSDGGETSTSSPPAHLLALKTELTAVPLLVNKAGDRDALDSALSMAAYAIRRRRAAEYQPPRSLLCPELQPLWDDEDQVNLAMAAWRVLHCYPTSGNFLADENWIHKECEETQWDLHCHPHFEKHPNSHLIDYALGPGWDRPMHQSKMVTFPVGTVHSITFERCYKLLFGKPGIQHRHSESRPNNNHPPLWNKLRLWDGGSIRAMEFMQLRKMPLGSRLNTSQDSAAHQFPSSDIGMFPAILCKSFDESVPQWAAHNAVAYVLTDVHAHLADLWAGSDPTNDAQPPVFAVTSCGQHWQVWIAYKQHQETSLVVAPLLRRPFGMCDFMDRFKLALMLKKLWTWLKESYQPSADRQLDRIWQDWITQYPDRAQRAFEDWFNANKDRLPPGAQPKADLDTGKHT
ncbi:unnamed protein product [Sympodiomycopsis kandeliae]